MKYIEYEIGRDTFSHGIPDHLLHIEDVEYLLFRVELELDLIKLSEVELKEFESDHQNIRDYHRKKWITDIQVVEQLF